MNDLSRDDGSPEPGAPKNDGRFKPGQSGNPKGRPRKEIRTHTRTQIENDVSRVLDEPVKFKGGEVITVEEALIRTAAHKAIVEKHGPSLRYLLNLRMRMGEELERRHADIVEDLERHEDALAQNPKTIVAPYLQMKISELRSKLRRIITRMRSRS